MTNRNESIVRRPPDARRRASVLIMVIALLVLLALIGTAAISTARVDRTSSRQHVGNVQIDMLVEGVRKMTIAKIVSALVTQGSLPDSVASDPDAGVTARQEWLSSRLPERLMAGPTEIVAGPSGDIVWRWPGAPIVYNGSPLRAEPPNSNLSINVADPATNTKFAAIPTFVTTSANGMMPALQFLDVVTNQRSSVFLAGDADGDGIADSVLWKLPISPIAGVTYYAAVRIIDHNSALNVNTARTPDNDEYNLPLSMAGVFPAGIDLYNQLVRPAEAANLEVLRGDANINLAANARTDGGGDAGFKFVSKADALWMQLGRRLDHPGYNSNGVRFGNGARPFGIPDGLALARRFILADASNCDSLIELAMDRSCRPTVPLDTSLVRTTRYAPNNVTRWFNENFNYRLNGQVNDRPARPLFVTHNPTRNFVYRKRGTWEAANNITDQMLDTWVSKTNLNTAAFEELWHSYFDVMADTALSSPFDDIQGWAEVKADAYKGQKFAVDFSSTVEMQSARMFRSPLRPNGPAGAGVAMTPIQVVLLRSAIAAANTISLRDPSPKPYSKQITIPAIGPTLPDGSPDSSIQAFTATVFGLKRQPFITEVYINNDPNNEETTTPPADPATTKFNPHGLVVIELHNPYDTELALGTDYKLVAVDRSTFPALTPMPIDDGGALSNIVIPAGKFAVISNFSREGTADGDSALLISKAPGFDKIPSLPPAQYAHVPKLHEVIGKEVQVIRMVDGKTMPIDSFDATGIPRLFRTKHDDEKKGPCEEQYYCRSNSPAAGRAWHFVYPGRYQVIDPTGVQRHQGTFRATWNPALAAPEPEPWLTALPMEPHFGSDTGELKNSRENVGSTSSFPIQICNSGMPGPNNGGKFPFSGFGRVGDALQAPFIGSYIVTNAGGTVELNAVTMDSVFAEDTDVDDDKDPFSTPQPWGKFFPFPEDIGRFSPWDAGLRSASGVLSSNASGTMIDVNDRFEASGMWNEYDLVVTNRHGGAWTKQVRRIRNYTPATSTTAGRIEVYDAFSPSDVNANDSYRIERVRYSWAADLFDYFTVIASPGNDFLPNTPLEAGGSPEKTKNIPDPARLVNRDGTPSEDNVPVEGLININTANWKVLAALPWVLNDDGSVNRQLSEVMARRIVYYRDVDDGSEGSSPRHPHGPFKSIFELLYIQDMPRPAAAASVSDIIRSYRFLTGEDKLRYDQPADAGDARLEQGDWTPPATATPHDWVRWDFEEKFLTLTRVSNLITTKSDCFTTYILVQGWRDAGGPNAKLVVQRRAASIVDRSGVFVPQTASPTSPGSTAVKVYNVPVE